ncbi:MAG: endonuclease [Alphaproteobacteria bacterium]|nr:endonuclease [Alphaproteobacteria bacterium]|tara:strand:+ start:829 stop:1071 length:243 start_codon:yes stop_codon:yes gene_type:complete
MSWFVYIVECADNSLYTGITNDLDRRIEQHNSGTGAKYTRNRAPVQLVYSEAVESRADALSREYKIKQLPRIKKIKLIKN